MDPPPPPPPPLPDAAADDGDGPRVTTTFPGDGDVLDTKLAGLLLVLDAANEVGFPGPAYGLPGAGLGPRDEEDDDEA